MANFFKFGTLFISGQPIKSQFFELHFEGKTPEITNSEFDKEITWIVVDGKLVSRRCLLKDISFRDMEALGLTGPTRIYINGQTFTMRLPQVGGDENETGSEWDSILKAVGTNDATLGWSGVFTWGSEELHDLGCQPSAHAVRGNISPRYWAFRELGDSRECGWRPVLEPVNTELRPELIGYEVAVWHGQQIIHGVLESYNDYDVMLKYSQRLFESDGERGQWYTQLGDSKLVIERGKIAALQLR